MEEAPENGKELSHSAHANGMNEWMNVIQCGMNPHGHTQTEDDITLQ
jgi:hypothetical protein